MPENFDLHEVSKRRRRDGDEGMGLGWGRSDRRLIDAEKRNEHAPQAQVYQLHQHKHLVSFRPQTGGLETLGIPYHWFNSSA